MQNIDMSTMINKSLYYSNLLYAEKKSDDGKRKSKDGVRKLNKREVIL